MVGVCYLGQIRSEGLNKIQFYFISECNGRKNVFSMNLIGYFFGLPYISIFFILNLLGGLSNSKVLNLES